MAYFMVDADPSVQFRSDTAAAVSVATTTDALSLRRESTAEWHKDEAALGTLTVGVAVVAQTATSVDVVLVAKSATGADVELAKVSDVSGPGQYVLRVDQSIIDILDATYDSVALVVTPTGGNVKFGAWMIGGDQPVARARGKVAFTSA